MTRLARPYYSSRTPLILENSIHLSYPLPRARAAFVAALRGLLCCPVYHGPRARPRTPIGLDERARETLRDASIEHGSSLK